MAWLTPRRPRLDGGLLPVVVQDAATGDVLMLAWANDEAIAATERTGLAHFWSRSRDELWQKGATSGKELRIVALATDCDDDAILYRVDPAGPACHTGARSCFEVETPSAAADPPFDLRALARLVESRRRADPASSYTARLLAGGPRRAAEKVVEEAGELATAALVGTDAEVRGEAADLLYHALVLLQARGLSLEDVERTLAERHAARRPADDLAGVRPAPPA
jgi:phosphoribosyl-ATP pyrophosphohydrolase/phosphoribosyl-AMP cyclohydrolase